jgi:hypothetical protein
MHQLPQRPPPDGQPFSQHRCPPGSRSAGGSRAGSRRASRARGPLQLPRALQRRQPERLPRAALHGAGRARNAPGVQDAVAAGRREPPALHARRPDRQPGGGHRSLRRGARSARRAQRAPASPPFERGQAADRGVPAVPGRHPVKRPQPRSAGTAAVRSARGDRTAAATAGSLRGSAAGTPRRCHACGRSPSGHELQARQRSHRPCR